MTRLRALNESSTDDSEEDNEEKETIEAQEERAFLQYRRALELRQQGLYSDAQSLLVTLLNDDFLADVTAEDQSAGADALARPAAALKYACLKNLGNVLVLQSRVEDGLHCYMQAVELDETDVTTWYQMGKVAIQIDDFHLASQAFQEGLRCNPRHWPCLDSLLPILYALNDYLGCLLLASRALVLDPQYPQALALRNQIRKEDPSLLQNFKLFFPAENDVTDSTSSLAEEDESKFISHALSLQERFKTKMALLSQNLGGNVDGKLHVGGSRTWEELGRSLLDMYRTVAHSSEKSFLLPVSIETIDSKKQSEPAAHSQFNSEQVKPAQVLGASSAVDVENEAMDVDSEIDTKGEDQTEEDVTEASGLEQEEETKAANSDQQNNMSWKRKKKKCSAALMDPWSKRRSGRRAGRKVEDRDESNLVSCFRSLLPSSLLSKDLEAEIAKAKRRRALRDPVDLLALGDDSVDTEELCRLLQERDAKDDYQQSKGQTSKENVSQRLREENYFSTDSEVSDICSFVKANGASTSNIIEILFEFISQLASKSSLTWPSSLILVYVEAYDCVRKHIPFPSQFDSTDRSVIEATLNTSLLYCEFIVDLWQQRNDSGHDMQGESGLTFAEALGCIMFTSGLGHIFTSFCEQLKTTVRINWLRAHLFLLQDNPNLAISCLQDVMDSLNIIEITGGTVQNDLPGLSPMIIQDGKKEESLNVRTTDPQSETYAVKKSDCKSANEATSHLNNRSELNTSPVLDGTTPALETDNIGSDSEKCESDREAATNLLPKISEEGIKDGQNLKSGGKRCVGTDASPVILTISENEMKPGNVEDNQLDRSVNSEVLKIDDQKGSFSEQHESGSNDVKESEKKMNQEECTEETLDISDDNGRIQDEGKAVSKSDFNQDMGMEEKSGVSETALSSSLKSEPSLRASEEEPIGDCSPLKPPQNDMKETSPTVQQRIGSEVDVEVTGSTVDVKKYETGESSGGCTKMDTSLPSFAEEEKKSIESSECRGSVTLSGHPVHSEICIFLPNCRRNQEISTRMVQKLLTSLTRQQQLSEVDDLYNSGQYDTLAGTLTECFKYCALQADSESPDIDDLPDRPTQMAMLLDSLWQLQKYSDCFYWSEACLYEAFSRYLNSTDTDSASPDQDDQQMWATTVERLLAGLNGCLKTADMNILEKLPKTCLTRLVQTLTSLLSQQLEHSDCTVEMAIECTTPWVILHRVILFEEQQLASNQDSIPSYMLVLFTAHEYMAKKARCYLNEGVLLCLILDVVVPYIKSLEFKSLDVNSRMMLIHEVDQAILCLYGHPKKPSERLKKKLHDHKVHQHLELTWERSLTLLKYYEPDEIPTFDFIGWKISPEEEQLFLRVAQLVPSECDPKRYLGKMKAYLRGSLDVPPEVKCSIPEAAWNLYYLLADFYLKTFKWEAAVKYYMLDVCLHPNRFDSWAGMALAQGTRLTTDINSCDTIDSDVQLRRKTLSQRCFQMAVKLDPENTLVWIEYGNFAYTVHSLCSRLLKTETESLSMEMFTKLEEEKDEMLNITERCFKTAEKLDEDERWLQQYMLGKVAEKRGEAPAVFLKHYRSAAQLLYESEAEYPLSLNYDPPQHYAFEAHEVHYRIHASILKNLELMEGKGVTEENGRLYKETLDEAAKSPFMAVRTTPQTVFGSAKRSSSDSFHRASKKMKMNQVSVKDSGQDLTLRYDKMKTTSGDQPLCSAPDELKRTSTYSTQQDASDTATRLSSSDMQLITSSLTVPSATAHMEDTVSHELPKSDASTGAEKKHENSIPKDDCVQVSLNATSDSLKMNTGLSQQTSVSELKSDTTTSNPSAEDSEQVMATSKICEGENVSSGVVDEIKSKTSLLCNLSFVDPVAGVLLNKCTPMALGSNLDGTMNNLSGVGVGSIGDMGTSRANNLHATLTVVAEHDYAVPFTHVVKQHIQASQTESAEGYSPNKHLNQIILTIPDIDEKNNGCRILSSSQIESCGRLTGSVTMQEKSSSDVDKVQKYCQDSMNACCVTNNNNVVPSKQKISCPTTKEYSLSSCGLKQHIQSVCSKILVTIDSSAVKSLLDDTSTEGCVSTPSMKEQPVNQDVSSQRRSVPSGPSDSSSGSPESPSDDSSCGSNNAKGNQMKQISTESAIQDLSKENKGDATSLSKSGKESQPVKMQSSVIDHAELVNQCLVGIEECLARYPRHYKSFYRLCHYYFRSKQHRNLKLCQMLLLGDYKGPRLNKSISGLFKSASVQSMFNDIWRIPIDEIDRAGSFASHMSRCVHLLMEVLRARRDHSYLLKLSIFLKRDPEKKEKKYLRDNERADLSKQALVMCFAAMRESAMEARNMDNLIDLFRTVKDGIKEIPSKEGTFKTLLVDAYTTYKKLRGLQQSEELSYDEVAELCQKEVQRKAAEAKAKALAAQAKLTAQAQQLAQAQLQAQVQLQSQTLQAQAQIMQMGVSATAPKASFPSLPPRFPAGINPALVANPLNPMFLPQFPQSRGRGRPPKAQQQLHSAMVAHMMGLSNTVPTALDSAKQRMTKQQKQCVQPQAASVPNPVVSSIIRDRPALSITTLPNTAAVTSATVGTNSVAPVRPPLPSVALQAMPQPRVMPSGQSGWHNRPRQTFPRPLPGDSSPRDLLPHAHSAPRTKSGAKSMPKPLSAPRPYQPQPPRPFVPQASNSLPLSEPAAAILSRLPGLQVKPRTQPVSSVPQQPGYSMPSNSKDLTMPRQHQSPLDRFQKFPTSSGQSSKPAVSINKVHSAAGSSGEGGSNLGGAESKKKHDSSFDIITLD